MVKNVEPFGMVEQVLLAHFDFIGTLSAPYSSQKSLELAHFEIPSPKNGHVTDDVVRSVHRAHSGVPEDLPVHRVQCAVCTVQFAVCVVPIVHIALRALCRSQQDHVQPAQCTVFIVLRFHCAECRIPEAQSSVPSMQYADPLSVHCTMLVQSVHCAVFTMPNVHGAKCMCNLQSARCAVCKVPFPTSSVSI